jgi:hypothetical protein
VVPTLLGLAGIDVEAAAATVAHRHVETQSLPGRDLSGLLAGSVPETALDAPVYFMTEDEISRGLRHANRFTGARFEPVAEPCKVESVVANLATGDGDTPELWKLNHYYDRLAAWDAEHGLAPASAAPPSVEHEWEPHNLSAAPEERENRVGTHATVVDPLTTVLDRVRDVSRRVPLLTSRAG